VELVALARFLAHRRVLVAVGMLLAVLAGVGAGARTSATAPPTAIASGRVLIDQQPSLVADLKGIGQQTIGIRAVLLGDLLATDAGRQAIARATGVPLDRLSVSIPSMSRPITAVPLPAKASTFEAMTQNAQPYGVTVISDDAVPILTISTHAPNRAEAVRLVYGATAGLRELIARRTVDAAHGVVAQPIGPPRDKLAPVVSHLPAPAVAPVTALMVFLLWCGGLLVASGLARAWRGTAPPRRV
jgi:hypothetical protein